MAQLVAPTGIIEALNNDYKSQISHTFIIHGNVYDFCDNTGSDLSLKRLLNNSYDSQVRADIIEGQRADTDGHPEKAAKPNDVKRVCVNFNISSGLQYAHPDSMKMMQAMIKEKYADFDDKKMQPADTRNMINFMNIWFEVSRLRRTNNIRFKNTGHGAMIPELLVTWVIEDADAVFPEANMANLGADRQSIVAFRQWSQDEMLANKNRIILVTRNASDLHSSIRSEISSIHLISKPNLEDRRAYIAGFERATKERAERSPKGKIKLADDNYVDSIAWAKDFDLEQCAIQSAGMNRRQLNKIFVESWIRKTDVDFMTILQRKQRVLNDEYQGTLDFLEPTFGFEEIGGQEAFKQYARERIIGPLKSGDLKTCSRGALMTGPPGTGKTMLAMALAEEAQMNFMTIDLGKVFAGIVGETEKKMRKLIEAIYAAAPCIVFGDELESVLSAGRSSAGDSGTSSRVFNNFMTFLSDPGRVGRIVFLGATNRPDMLDPALIRPGRMDVKIPILPPSRADSIGRRNVLGALVKKHKITFHSDLEKTLNTPDAGLGKLLLDTSRIWTGAEIENLMRKAITKAVQAKRVYEKGEHKGEPDERITAADWNTAMRFILPNTGMVEMQIGLALQFVDDLEYCPTEYWDQVHAEQEKARARAEREYEERAA